MADQRTKREQIGPLVKPRRPFHLPPNRKHKNKRDKLANPKHRGFEGRYA